MANKEGSADWTIMVYVAADSVLANFAIESLKQLKKSADKDVVVAVQLDVDGQVHPRKIDRFCFDGTGDREGSINDDRDSEHDVPSIGEMTNPKTLTDFINWATTKCKAKRYCLMLWGHGPSLLEEADAEATARANSDPHPETATHRRLYMTPIDLGNALKNTQLIQNGKGLDIVGIDACCMSLVEVACQLRGYADFLVASQEEVPDASFPYDRILPLFRNNKDDVAAICLIGVQGYKRAYQDYVFTARTTMQKVTLASLRPGRTGSITEPMKELVAALQASADDPEMRQVILASRADTKGFVGGLFADLYNFCDILGTKLNNDSVNEDLAMASKREDLAVACKQVCAAIAARGDDACIAENEAMEPERCHGLSIYFPYLTDDQIKEIKVTPVKGGTDVLNKGGTDVLNKLRRDGIEQTEQEYYRDLDFSHETGWDQFIAHCWSRILAEEVPDQLDMRYSAQQCARNLLDLWKGMAPLPPNQLLAKGVGTIPSNQLLANGVGKIS